VLGMRGNLSVQAATGLDSVGMDCVRTAMLRLTIIELYQRQCRIVDVDRDNRICFD